MELDNFFLAEYDFKNIDHKTVIIKLENADCKNYLGDLEYYIHTINQERDKNPCNHAYIVYQDMTPVGFISLANENGFYQIRYGIIPEKRGNQLASSLLKEFSVEMFNLYPEIDEFTLIISKLNTPSKKTADLAGYTQENSVRYTRRRK